MDNTSPDARTLALHEAICRCRRCLGQTDPHKLCRDCVQRQNELDTLQMIDADALPETNGKEINERA
jgi:hypothetical protein